MYCGPMRNKFQWRGVLTIPPLNVPSKVWSGMQCPNCKMVFALPPFGAPSSVNVMEVLREELERHVQQTHVDLPSCSLN